ncbi:MAG: hypothetical protein JW827_04190 [Spirochaetes bacterium]|nr:hypothetical protein [Spirochaetota bacterium]
MRKILFFILFMLCLTYIHGKPDIQLSDVNVYSELKSKLSDNTNKLSKNYEIFQEVNFKLKSQITEDLSAWIKFKSEYLQFHWKKDDRFLFINSMALEYQLNPVSKMMLGSIMVNYSPYVAMSFPWVHDLFRGLAFEYTSYQLYIHTFIANNGDNPDETTWSPPVDFDLDYRFIDKGYDAKGQQQEYPTLWAGLKATYAMDRNPVFTPDLTFYYFRENYTKRDYKSGYVDINDNNICGLELNFNLLDYAEFKNFGALTMNKTDKYTAITNYYGAGKTRMDYDKMEYGKYYAGKLRMEIDDIFSGLLYQFNTRGFIEYEYVDSLYHPTYMNQNLDNRTINPYDNVFSGREGAWVGVEQHVGLGFYPGVGYQRYLYKNSYYHNFPDGSVFTEKQITLKNDLIRQFRVFFIYQMIEMAKGTLPEGEKKMNSFYIRIQSDIVNNVYLELEYSRNKEYFERYDEMLIKFFVWGW